MTPPPPDEAIASTLADLPHRPGAILNQRLENQLGELQSRSLRRSLRALPSAGKVVEVEGRELLNLAGNDYLALAQHPKLKVAATLAIEQFGVGSGASRLVAGHLVIHERVETKFAAFKHAEAALIFPTGYTANLAVLTSLPQAGDLICQDKLNHASLIDAAKFSPAEVRTYPHPQASADHAKLERLLRDHAERSPNAGRWIVTDSVFSMDGDVADLPGLCDLAERYDAVVVVDEAHGTGVLGETGAGLAERQGVVGRVPITISTASKALGGLGGIVTADRVVIETLVNRGRPMIYSTAVPPSQAAAIGAGVEVIRDEPERRERLASISQSIRTRLTEAGWPHLDQSTPTPILPLVTGGVASALALQERLAAAGLLAVAIRPPTVAPGAARVRLSLRADLTDAEIESIIAAVGIPEPT
ncbi:MAG: 8-amino-7-oxononanoate synthase [Planctomycetota bacterium]